MAQDFIGSNNLNLLMPNGQFGTRLDGGKDAASPRYVFTQLMYVTSVIDGALLVVLVVVLVVVFVVVLVVSLPGPTTIRTLLEPRCGIAWMYDSTERVWSRLTLFYVSPD